MAVALTEGWFQFQMLTRALFVSTTRACDCVSGLMYLLLIMTFYDAKLM